MRTETDIKQQITFIGDECKRVRVYGNPESDWQNVFELSSEYFPFTPRFREDDAVLTLTDLTNEENRYKISGRVCYIHSGNTPEAFKTILRIMLANPTAEDEKRTKQLQNIVKNSTRLIINIEQKSEDTR